MSTKLGKNFGLGNSYKNVKLVKQAVRKVDENTEKFVEQALVADKDIISQLKVSKGSGSTTITFPKNVLPLRFYFIGFIGDETFEETLFFDYSDYHIVDSNKDYYGDCNISNECVSIIIDGYEIDIIDDCDLSFCYFNSTEDLLNTWNLFYPQTGTKLYKHTLKDSNDNYLYLISTDANQYSGSGTSFILLGGTFEHIVGMFVQKQGLQNLLGTQYQGQDSIPIYYISGGTISTMNFNTASYTDSVIQL